MIHCMVTAKHAYTWGTFLGNWGKSLAPRVKLLAYEDVLEVRRSWDHAGVYVFCDLDRLQMSWRVKLARLHTVLADAHGSRRVLNHPVRSMYRYDLLRTLHAAGLNRFGVQWARRRDVPARYPVVLRQERGCIYEQLPVLRDEAAYRAALAQLREAKERPDELMAVEYCDTADGEGVYRKYGAFIVGERIVPRHVFFSRNWMVKQGDLDDARYLEEERAYLDANPHAEALQRVARIADISYGRIDYAMLDGAVQTWEINTNPMIASVMSETIPAREPAIRTFCELFERAFAALEGG